MGAAYFKITDIGEVDNGIICRDGLNVFNRPFDENSNGFTFTTIDNIPKFYKYGIYLREIELPIKDPDFKMYKDGTGKHRANKIIFGTRYSLFDKETYQKFNLDMSDNKYIVDFACREGKLQFLEWWRKSGIKLEYSSNAIEWASIKGHISILKWWKKSGLELKYTGNVIDSASNAEDFKILNWWKSSGLELKYTDEAIDFASVTGNIRVLNWWRKSNLELKYSTDAIDQASANGNTNVLEWWWRQCNPPDPLRTSNSLRLELKYTEKAMDLASAMGNIEMLDWWLKHSKDGLELRFSGDALVYAKDNMQTEIIAWWNNFFENHTQALSNAKKIKIFNTKQA